MTTLRAKVRKTKTENGIEERISQYRKAPDASGDEEHEASKPAPAPTPGAASISRLLVLTIYPAKAEKAEVKEKAPEKPKKQVVDDDDDEESDWGNDDESSDSGDDVHVGGYKASDFLKKDKTKPAKKDDVPKPAPKPRQQQEQPESDDAFEPAITARKRAEKPLFGKDEKVDAKGVLNKLGEILISRGRKGTSAADQMALLQRLRQVTFAHDGLC